MRKLKIVNDGFLETEDGHIIECPKKFKQCHNTCAWFNIREWWIDDNKYLPDECRCNDAVIGDMAEGAK